MKLQNKRIVVTGGAGFVGRYVVAKLKAHGAQDIFVPRSQDYDLRKREICRQIVKDKDIVIHLAAHIGGIAYNYDYQGEVFYDNLIMGAELMEAARLAGIKKFVSTGTVCEYPKFCPLPFREDDLWNGYPDEITGAYGMAKKMFIVQGEAYRKQYGFNSIHIIPVNLYGPEDNFNRISGHVIPSLIRKVIEAREQNKNSIEVWGTGKATREFLYVEDAAEGIILALEKYDEPQPINLGTGVETSIKSVTELIMDIIGYKGKIKWNKNEPDGQPRRQLDVSKARELGFVARTNLREGLKKTIEWYEKNKY